MLTERDVIKLLICFNVIAHPYHVTERQSDLNSQGNKIAEVV